MNDILLLFFALPVAISILAIIFETLIHSPIKIAGIAFAILLIITFTVADETFLIFTILYTILAYVVAWITSQWVENQNQDNCLERLIQNTNLEALQNTQSIQNMQNSQNQNNQNCNCRRRFN